MTLHTHKTLPTFILTMFLTLGAIVSILYLLLNTDTTTSALTYSSSTDISFTFSPRLSISLSDTDLIIDTLTPGTTSTSNPITITVASNTPYGYSLYADAGSNNTESIYYNTSDLVRNDTTIDPTPSFTSIATNASLTTLDTDNTWGYSTSTDNGTTWSAYNGLPTTTSTSGSTSTDNPTLLIDTKDPADSSKSIDFRVAARASTTQASGTYSNIINFYAVGKPKPPSIDDIEYLQDFIMDPESIKSSMAEHVVYTKKDKRDEQDYTIAKLRDGNIWMTKNLNIPGGSEITSEFSDVPEGYNPPALSGFQSENRLPVSSTSGFSINNVAYVYNSDKTTGLNCSPPGCYSYYSWTAATAGSGLSIKTGNIDAPYSICPKGWKLPNSKDSTAADWQSSDFHQLTVAYGMSPENLGGYDSGFFREAGPGTVPNFLLTGYYVNNSGPKNYEWGGFYWSSTVSNYQYQSYANTLFFRAGYTASGGGYERKNGQAVRCLAR